MKKIKIKNNMIEYIPRYKIHTQKLLVFLLWKIKKQDLLAVIKEKNWLRLEFEKEEIFWIFSQIEKRKRRSIFYEAKESLHEIIKINYDDQYVETSFISWTDEKKRGKTIIFYIPYQVINAIADKDGNYYTIDFVLFSKFKKKYSIILYQLLLRHKYKWKMEVTPKEINEVFGTNMQPSHIKDYFYTIRKEFWSIWSNIDYTLQIIKEKQRIKLFKFAIFDNWTELEYNAIKEEKEVMRVYNSILNCKQDKKTLFINSKIDKLSEYQAQYFYDILRNKRKELDQNIIMKVEGICKGTKTEYYNKMICKSVLLLNYSVISKVINNCSIEIAKGKIKNNIAFVVSRLLDKMKPNGFNEKEHNKSI